MLPTPTLKNVEATFYAAVSLREKRVRVVPALAAEVLVVVVRLIVNLSLSAWRKLPRKRMKIRFNRKQMERSATHWSEYH